MTFLKKLFGKKATETTQPENNNTNNEPSPQMPAEDSLQTVAGRIFPYFKQFLPSSGPAEPFPEDMSAFDKTKTYELPNFSFVFKTVCADLHCLYAIDNDYGYTIIMDSHLTNWGISSDELHTIALANFRNLVSSNMQVHGDTNGVMLTIDGNLEAGLILIDEIWDQLESQIGEPVVIMVPSRDVVVATGQSNRATIEGFKNKARTILASASHPLSKNVFIRTNKSWQLFESIDN